MNKEEILEKVQSKTAQVGEMEHTKMGKGNWIAIIVAGILAVAFMIIEGLLGHFSSIYVLGAVCYTWASVFYFCQYFVAKRPKGVLVGGILHGLAAITMIVFYIIRCVV